MRFLLRIVMVLAVALGTTLWALTIPVKFPSRAKIKPTTLVDELGNVLFGSTNPGKVELLTKASQLGTITAFLTSTACPEDGFAGRLSKAFDGRVRPGGGGRFDPFTIPAGQVFVVTSFDWIVTGAPASRLMTVSLKLETAAGFNVASAQSAALADSSGAAGASATLGGGIVIEGDNLLCFTVPGELVAGPQPGLNFAATAQGYFAPDS